MRVLCLSGGGFKGAFQVPVVEYLMTENEYDLILGVSVGAINGACAAQGDLELMRWFWERIDCKNPILGVKNFLSFAAHRGKGWFSLNPTLALLQEHISLDKLQIPYGCGVVARETSEYYTMLASEMKSDWRLHRSIIASAAIAALMEPVKMRVQSDMKRMILSDGGHRHVLPVPPVEATHVDAVFCNKITPDRREQARVDKFFEALAWMFDIQVDNYTFSDFSDLEKRCLETGMTATVYSPTDAHGSLLACARETLRKRMREGERALKNPVTIGH
jgi:predicted acylesterase/phospholipase RssA